MAVYPKAPAIGEGVAFRPSDDENAGWRPVASKTKGRDDEILGRGKQGCETNI